MATVKIKDSAATPAAEKPSDRVVREAAAITRVTDETGRTIGVKRLNALDKMRVFKAVGGENAKNEAYLGFAMLACSVVEIDGIPEGAPATIAQIEAMVARLDDAGIEAVAGAVADFVGMNAEQTIDSAKN